MIKIALMLYLCTSPAHDDCMVFVEDTFRGAYSRMDCLEEKRRRQDGIMRRVAQVGFNPRHAKLECQREEIISLR